MSRPFSRRAFTLTDLMICLAMALIVLGGVVPSVVLHARLGDDRIKCSSNLKQLGMAIKMYANDEVRNGNAYPRTRYKDGATPVVGTSNPPGWNDDNSTRRDSSADSFVPGKGAPEPNDVTGALFQILRTQDIFPDTFVCPASSQDRMTFDQPTETIQYYTNWTNGSTGRRSIGKTLSYSYSNPYGNMAAISNGFAFNDSMTGEFAIMADINPGSPELMTTLGNADASAMQKINSPNHNYDGQNVLYADGHTEWATSPFAGAQRDNIYTARKSASSGGFNDTLLLAPSAGTMLSPVDGRDSVMLPTWDPSTPLPSRSLLGGDSGMTMLILVGVGVAMVLVLVAAVVIFLIVRRRPPTPPPGMPGAPPPIPMGR